MKKHFTLVMTALLTMVQGAFAASQTWKSGGCVCTLEDGVFTVSKTAGGNGIMADYDWNNLPWGADVNEISKLVVKDGVTVIGKNAFRGCDQLTSVTLNEGVSEIHYGAFWFCGRLHSIELPLSVTKVAADAFHCCNDLMDVYCKANAEDISWGVSVSDFIQCYGDKWPRITRIHVNDLELANYQTKFGEKLNATFVPEHWSMSGQGTMTDPYVIMSQDHWNRFAKSVTKGNTYAKKFITLADDITVTTMAGTIDQVFSGIFDGNGHTLTVNYNGKANAALFPKADNATIKNLHVNGTITSSTRLASGLIGRVAGNNLIENCRVSVVLKNNATLERVGGFVGEVVDGPNYLYSNFKNLTIKGSVFDGQLLVKVQCPSGFVAGMQSAKIPVNIENCFFAPTAIEVGGVQLNSFVTFVNQQTTTQTPPTSKWGLGGGVNSLDISKNYHATTYITNCFYTHNFGDEQGAKVIETEDIPSFVNASPKSPYYSVSELRIYENKGCTFNNKYYVVETSQGREFAEDFDGQETTGMINSQLSVVNSGNAGTWYDLNGRRLSEKPTTPGIYIVNGKKVVIK